MRVLVFVYIANSIIVTAGAQISSSSPPAAILVLLLLLYELNIYLFVCLIGFICVVVESIYQKQIMATCKMCCQNVPSKKIGATKTSLFILLQFALEEIKLPKRSRTRIRSRYLFQLRQQKMHFLSEY